MAGALVRLPAVGGLFEELLTRRGKACFNLGMKKSDAIALLGGTVRAAAELVGTTRQAVSQWPDELTRRIEDRVQAALWRMERAKKRHAKRPQSL